MSVATVSAAAERLLSASDAPVKEEHRLDSQPLWRAFHAGGFLLGGLTFLAGTGLLFPACAAPLCATLSAALYTAGSLGFLAVDLLETWAFLRAPCALRVNIALSALGSTLYVFGSVCFLPAVLAAAPGGAALGLAGFLAGSAVIAASQACKVARVLRGACGGSSAGGGGHGADAEDTLTAVGVEGGAGLGALLFLAGTALDAAGAALAPVLWTWMAGSTAFTLGAACLLARHYALGIT